MDDRISDVFDTLSTVWTWPTVAVALVAGFALGVTVVGYLSALPAYASGVAAAWKYGLLTALGGALAGGVFYVGQALVTFAESSDAWERVVSRWGLWALYSAALGFGTFVRLEVYRRRRQQEKFNAGREVANNGE